MRGRKEDFHDLTGRTRTNVVLLAEAKVVGVLVLHVGPVDARSRIKKLGQPNRHAKRTKHGRKLAYAKKEGRIEAKIRFWGNREISGGRLLRKSWLEK